MIRSYTLRPLLFCTVMLLCAAGTLSAQEDAQSLHKRLVEEFNSVQSLRIVATSSTFNNSKVTISAKRKDKYILELSDRRIYCDGKTIWNYTPSKKSVVVSNYSAQGNSLSVEKLFLELIGAYKPTALKNEILSKGGSNYQLRLEPQGAPRYGVKSLILSIDKKSLSIKSLSVDTDQGKQEWTLSSLQRNPDLKDALFSFKAPKGVEIIDLRN